MAMLYVSGETKPLVVNDNGDLIVIKMLASCSMTTTTFFCHDVFLITFCVLTQCCLNLLKPKASGSE
jgi:hypothetical protein